METRVMEQNRLSSTPLPAVRRDIEAHIRFLNRKIVDVEKQMKKLIDASDALRHKDDILQSVPGIGAQVSRTLLVRLPELGTLDRRRLSCLVGLAPVNWDSGAMKGSRHIRGGRATRRAALYQPATCASHFNSALKALYTR